MSNQLTLGSLFDGSGGFPLAGQLCGIKPIWASEIEPFPIKCTTKRFPDMKHYGNVCDIHGDQVEPVDIITFGSPCQDLSLAGKRAGLQGERSNLFFQALRIIKEMRGATNGKYPRYAVWENVAGAFTSNNGADFLSVIRGLADCSETGISIPGLDKWSEAGCVMADNFSLAWRTLNAQFWGVPQRRRRIYLVADFNGRSAREILFKSESVSGYYKQVQKKWKDFTRGTEKGIDKSRMKLKLYENHSQDLRWKELPYVCETLSAAMGMGGNNQPFVVKDNKVRKLTPTECARLQGFPDWWCADIEHRDSAEYKMWGNGIALPCALRVLAEIVEETNNGR